MTNLSYLSILPRMHIEGYQILKSIGAGATSEVFSAIREKDKTEVALKRFFPLVTRDPDLQMRLEMEVETLLTLKHPNIVNCYGTFKDEESWGLELELVSGAPLNLWAKSYELQLLEPKLWILVKIAQGLAAAHEMGILHRDLKPENVLISNAGDVKLSDFGLARQLSRVTITKSGLLVGSLAYMAPEVINHSDAAIKSDVFSFGVIAYELLVGQNPFESETPQAMIRKIMASEHTPAREANSLIPQKISELISSCLNSDPKKRPDSVWHIEAELQLFLSKTEMIPFCKNLVSPIQRTGVLSQALKTKHQNLIQGLKTLGPKQLSEKLQVLTELQILFPQDETAIEFLNQINDRKPKFNKKFVYVSVVGLFFTILSAVLLRIFNLQSGFDSPKNIQTTQISQTDQTNSRVQDTIQLAAQVTTTTTTLAPVVSKSIAKGAISFAIPEDVSVYVDEEPVPSSKRNNYEVAAGKYIIKMVKEGYLPIMSSIVVKPGKTTTVRAGATP